MANQPLNSSVVTYEALMVLENQLVFSTKINRKYDGKFGVDGAKIGDTVSVRKPAKYLGRDGQTIQIEDFTETSVPVALTTQSGVDVAFSSSELLLDIDDFSNRVLKPAVSRVATRLDLAVMQICTQQVANYVGTPGTVPNAILTYLTSGQILDDNAAPQDEQRYQAITSKMQITVVDALKGLFQSSEQIASQYMKGRMGVGGGFLWYMTQNVYTQTVGALGGTPLVHGANQSGTSLITNGWTAAALQRLNVGDRFTIASVYHVNPASLQATSDLQPFVVMAPGSSDGAGNMTITIQPPIIGPGSAFQTVDSLPADNAAITVVGAANTKTPVGLAFHTDFATLVCADLPMPKNIDMSGIVSDDQLGLSIRLARDWDVVHDIFPCRLDLLWGANVLRGELAVAEYS